METQSSDYNTYIENGILANNEFGITSILNIRDIKSMFFTNGLYSVVEGLIEEKDIGAINGLTTKENGDLEYLDILAFEDQNGRTYVVTAYDSSELWQDPQVIKIYLI